MYIKNTEKRWGTSDRKEKTIKHKNKSHLTIMDEMEVM